MASDTKPSMAFVGSIVHSVGEPQLSILDKAVLIVQNGKVATLDKVENLDTLKAKYEVTDGNVYHLQKGEFLMPGMVDTHIHAPQYPNVGLGYDRTLLEWLDEYTFPLEASYSDTEFAAKVYEAVVRRLLAAGTTTACYFATIHEESSVLLARLTNQLGQRALVGKVNMNREHPDYYGETTEDSLTSTENFIKAVKALNNPLVQPIITPRFAISCDEEIMTKLGKMATTYGVHIQTHISETLSEIAYVKELFPACKTYADVYDQSNLLTNKTVLAHGVYLEDEELTKLAAKGTSISHCPNSNVSLQSGMCDVKRLLAHNVKVGLGTDMSGGYGHSVMDAMRHALTVSTCLSFNKVAEYTPLNYQDAFHLATLGGAQALSLDSVTGNFAVGKDFDALIINMNSGTSDLLKDYSTAEIIQKFVYLADDRNISRVYIAGKHIKT